MSLAAGCGDNTPGNKDGGGGAGLGGQGGSSNGGSAGGTTTDGGLGGSPDGGPGGSAAGAGGAGGAVGGAGGAVGGHAGSMAGAGGAVGGHAGSMAGAGGAVGGAGGAVGGHAGSTAGAGGTATGGTGGSGGAVGGAGGTATPCYTTAFTAPTSGATLTVADDADQTCSDGFQYTVTISSNAPNGTDVTLYDGATLLKTVQVSGGAASFAVQLSTGGTAQQLSIQYPSTATCNVTENVTVNCPNTPPTCSISAPVISATHPDLNGVPAPAGDRSSSSGSPYQAAFVVSTNAEDGQTVTLSVLSDATNPPSAVDGTPTATVSGGSATFGLTLVPDGTYEVTASCVNKNGITGTSTKSTFTVDTAPPDLTVNSPSSGQFVIGNVNVCAQTASADAASLASSLGAAQNNLCVTIGSSATPSCTKVAAVNTPTCISFPCPQGAPFGLTITLKDVAGNPTTQTLTGVTCTSSLPSVQIVAPASDAPAFTDPSKHILAANAPIGVKDQNASTAGAQADVVACTDTSGTATLFGGHKGDASLSQIGSPITTAAAAPADNCPAGLGFVARFSGVTLPESNENADGTLAAATEIAVSVTAAVNSADTGSSLPDDVWVDSVAPALALQSPANLCGSFTQSASTVTEDVSYTADDKLVVAEVTNNGTTTTYDTPAFVGGVATFGSVAFAEGQNALVATESDPAGNATVLATCTVTIGAAPVVTFTTPTSGAILCPATATDPSCFNDTDASTPGWQGNLAVHVTAGGVPVVGSTVTFSDSTSGVTYGGSITDASGNAQFNGVTVPEGVQTLVATTDNVPNAGVGSGSATVTVDTGAPNAPTGLDVEIPTTDPKLRRQVLMHMKWTAPSDAGGGSVAGYQIRYAKVPIDSSNFNNLAVVTAVTYSGTPLSPGQTEGIDISPLYMENNYYFAVAAVDVAGTLSPILASASSGTCTCLTQCCVSHFNQTIINSPAGTTEVFGAQSDGSADVNGDGISDIIVGTSNASRAYLFLGSSTFAGGAPSVTFSSTTDPLFGTGVAQIGDIDGDGFQDIAIADLTAAKVYIYKGRSPWPPTLTDLQADYTISTTGMWSGASAGASMARLGDFDGDGVDDFAIGGPVYSGRSGRVAVVYGSKTFSNFTLPDATRALEIGADSALNRTQFGSRVVGLGHFYSVTSGTTLVVAAPGLGAASSTSDNQGRLYAFHGRPAGAAIDATSADAVVVGPGKGAEIGQLLMNLGPAVNGLASLGSGNPGDTLSVAGASGTGFVFSGSSATGPFSSDVILDMSSTVQAGQMLFGGGLSGRDTALSVIGDGKVDIAVLGKNGAIDIIDGALFGSLTSPVNADQKASVIVPLPAPWSSTSVASGGLVPDINNDGIPDFVLGDTTGTSQGRIVIFW